MALIIRSSSIHAAGCYTTEPIRKGARILEYTGHILTAKEADRRYERKDFTYLFGLGDGKRLVDGHGIAAFLNHSCNPNCETDEEDGRIWIFAARNIKAGEELVYDYNLYDGNGPARCNCGARRCRGTMYSPEEIRRRKRKAKKAKERRRAASVERDRVRRKSGRSSD